MTGGRREPSPPSIRTRSSDGIGIGTGVPEEDEDGKEAMQMRGRVSHRERERERSGFELLLGEKKKGRVKLLLSSNYLMWALPMRAPSMVKYWNIACLLKR